MKRKLETEGAAFDRFLHVGSPNQGNRAALMERIHEMLDRNWFSNRGPLVQEFEEKLADYLGVRHCITMCNGTVALEIAIRALDLSGEVIIPSMTFIATAHALSWQGITPVFCDIDPETACLDPLQVQSLITDRTTGIIGVHLYGRTCETDGLQQVADENGLKLMYDAAHAFGCMRQGHKVGRFGACEVFSFHATKFFNTFEGGAVATNDDELAQKIRLMQNFGFSGLDNVIYPGTNGKMTEVCAAAGLVNLESVDSFIELNKQNYEAYCNAFSSIPGLELRRLDQEEQSNYQYVIAEVGDEFPAERDALMKHLHHHNVLVRRYFWPGCHQMEPYRTQFSDRSWRLPETERMAERILVFPTGSAVSAKDVEVIAGLINSYAQKQKKGGV